MLTLCNRYEHIRINGTVYTLSSKAPLVVYEVGHHVFSNPNIC